MNPKQVLIKKYRDGLYYITFRRGRSILIKSSGFTSCGAVTSALERLKELLKLSSSYCVKTAFNDRYCFLIVSPTGLVLAQSNYYTDSCYLLDIEYLKQL